MCHQALCKVHSRLSASAKIALICELKVFMYVFFFTVLGFVLKALTLLGRHSTPWAHSPALLCVYMYVVFF
jgi:hypothetical protein